MSQYQILMHEEAFQKARSYFEEHKKGSVELGAFLSRNLNDIDISQLTPAKFIERLINTKRPQIFAESDVMGDGQDWNPTELSILGDVSIAVPVTVFDNGLHTNPEVHADPFEAALLYVPGALLQNGWGNPAADWEEATVNGEIDSEAYYKLYVRRLLPSFVYVNDSARSRNKQAFVTIPGLGCGQFAGIFHGQLGSELRSVLIEFLMRFGHRFSNIRAVYYDPYGECANERLEIGEISFFVRPLMHGNEDKSQLCEPRKYEEHGDEFAGCHLFSVVAWDHVSWPGNDFYVGSRVTDDGVKAAATNSMAVMTGVEGYYNDQTFTYDPPMDYGTWENVVRKDRLQIHVKDNMQVMA